MLHKQIIILSFGRHTCTAVQGIIPIYIIENGLFEIQYSFFFAGRSSHCASL